MFVGCVGLLLMASPGVTEYFRFTGQQHLSPELIDWAQALANLRGPRATRFEPRSPVSLNQARHRGSIWNPQPECARQIIAAYLHMWVQCYTDTWAIFVVPRVLQRHWGRISRYVEEVGIAFGLILPTSCRFESHIPFVVLCIRPGTPILRPRLEHDSMAYGKDWHFHQAEEVRRLS